MICGVDLSHKNGKIDWDLLGKRDVQFVFIQATEAVDSIDPMFEYNLTQAKGRGIPSGAYHWLHPRLHVGQQAELFAHTVQSFSGLLPPVVCLEKHRAPAEDMEKNVTSFLKIVEARTGVRPIIYTSQDYWGRYLPGADWGCEYALWVDNPGDHFPAQVWPWAKWTFWQQSYQERLPGISTDCGINWFNGSKNELVDMVVQ